MKKKITMRKKKKNAVMIAEMPLLCLPSAIQQDGAASESSSCRPGIVRIFSFSETWDF